MRLFIIVPVTGFIESHASVRDPQPCQSVHGVALLKTGVLSSAEHERGLQMTDGMEVTVYRPIIVARVDGLRMERWHDPRRQGSLLDCSRACSDGESIWHGQVYGGGRIMELDLINEDSSRLY
jgi:hypothetical protein